MNIGEQITMLRKTRGLSQKQLADATGLSNVYINEIEKSKKNPSIDTILKITKALDVTVSELLGEKDIQLKPLHQSLLSAVEHYDDEALRNLIVYLESTKPHRRVIKFDIDGKKGSYVIDTHGKSEDEISEIIKKNTELIHKLYVLKNNNDNLE